MPDSVFAPSCMEFVGVAPGHTIGLVISSIDAKVRELLNIPAQYTSVGLISTRIGACTQIAAADDAAKATNTALVLFELARDTEGYGGPGAFLALGAEDVVDARRAVELTLAGVVERAKTVYINEVGHMEVQTSASAGPVLHQIFGTPLKKPFGFTAIGPAAVGMVTADAAAKSAPVEIVWHGSPGHNTPFHNDVIITVTGNYEAVLTATNAAFEKGRELIATLGSVPASIYEFGQ